MLLLQRVVMLLAMAAATCSARTRTSSTSSMFEKYILAPTSRIVLPRSIYRSNGSVSGVENLLEHSSTAPERAAATFQDSAAVTFDFGKTVEGIISVDVASLSHFAQQWVGVTFSESSLWISSDACDGTSFVGVDEPLWFNVYGRGVLTASPERRRGAFRFMTLITNGTGSIQINAISTRLTIEPDHVDDTLRDYRGYFHCESDLLNRVWYGGAWTVQLCHTSPQAGDALIYAYDYPLDYNPRLGPNDTDLWYLNATVSEGRTVLLDGAKRDRLVWGGDYSVSLPTRFYTEGNLDGAKNGLASLYALQNSSGAIPYNSFPAPIPTWGGFSFSSHLYTLIASHDYWLFTGDHAFLRDHWQGITKAMAFVLEFVDDKNGLLYVTVPEDWLRNGFVGYNMEANAMLYHTLKLVTTLAQELGDLTETKMWQTYAEGIKSAVNNLLWDEKSGMYRDNLTTTLLPQDGNSWAVKANITMSSRQAKLISEGLHSRWGPYGAPAPECFGETVNPFGTAFELETHYIAGNPQYSVGLMEYMWGNYMLDDPRMTKSTYLERYSQNGDLTYAPVTNNARISHTHGWSTGPNIALSKYAAGIRLMAACGREWLFWPQPGNLTDVQAGFETNAGRFSAHWKSDPHSGSWTYSFKAPSGTCGSLKFNHPRVRGTLFLRQKRTHEDQSERDPGKDHSDDVPIMRKVQRAGTPGDDEDIVMDGLQGGSWCASWEPDIIKN